MIIVLLIYVIIGLFIYFSELRTIINEEPEFIEDFNYVEHILCFFFVVILWFPILMTYWFTTFFDNFS